DVFAAAVAPGVSAPAVKGIDLATFEAIFKHIQGTGKIKLLDIAECNPKFDLDNRTAKLAAYIVYQYLFS
ncbi:MAG: arginase family protein, partial [Acinetobacter sp.]|nr:arginase family protein [Acinetobacter sp.]